MDLEADVAKLSMDEPIEHEICANCKKEIPHFNYVMHTAHCARKITLCPICKEPIPKNEFEQHKEQRHRASVGHQKRSSGGRMIEEAVDFPRQISKTPIVPPKVAESKRLTASNGAVSRNLGTLPKKAETGDRKADSFSLKEPGGKLKVRRENALVTERSVQKVEERKSTREANVEYAPPKTKDGLLACKFCDLELPKLELDEHENYCGSRTDKCNVCGELVMFKYKKLHEESNHGFLKLRDEPGPRASWDSDTERTTVTAPVRRERPPPIYTVNSFDFSPLYRSYSNDFNLPSENDKKETYKDISRRLDCQAPQPPQRRPNPPTELTIPCEFCNTPIPHDDLIQHETGCRPDLARLSPRRRSPSPSDDDYYLRRYPDEEPPQSPEVELPCEFCSDMFPASQLLRHQLSCN